LAEPHDFSGIIPDGLQKLLDLSERVFLLRLAPDGSILACSDSLRKIIGEPDGPVGRKFEEIFLAAVAQENSLCMADLTGYSGVSPLLVRLAMSNRPCRLFSVADGENFIGWGEVIGDRSTTGLNEVSGFAGQIQSLLARIRKQNIELQQGLNAASWLQNRFLPEGNRFADIQAAWLFRPCESISGDYFNIFIRKDGRVAVYILDVSGHGLASAMMGIAATQSIQQIITSCDADPDTKSDMPLLLAKLEQEFPIERFNLYFSMVYLEIDPEYRRMTWVNAGHPDPILVRREQPSRLLKGGGPFIGLDQAELVDVQTLELQPGDRVYLYSDGITERRNPAGAFFGEEELLATLESKKQEALQHSVDAVTTQNDTFGAPLAAQDDLTLVGFEIPLVT
jgi:sigma-B regulation protein RsbU (phosphoserine phosphatase)